jgi:hypothetical protein
MALGSGDRGANVDMVSAVEGEVVEVSRSCSVVGIRPILRFFVGSH